MGGMTQDQRVANQIEEDVKRLMSGERLPVRRRSLGVGAWLSCYALCAVLGVLAVLLSR